MVARLGSSSSMTKAASKTAGSRFAAPSSFLETSWLCFLGLGFLAADAALLLLETDEDCLGLPVLLPAPACSLAAFWRACSSAMTLSSEPLRRWNMTDRVGGTPRRLRSDQCEARQCKARQSRAKQSNATQRRTAG